MPTIAGVILASGMSRRFGDANKLLAPVAGVPVARRVTEAFVQALPGAVWVVVGYQAEAVREALHGLPVTFVANSGYEQGQSTSLVAAIRALPADARAVVLGVADQPFLRASVVRSLVDRHRETGSPLVVPRYGDAPGNPVLYGSALFPELLAVTGDRGGRPVRDRHRKSIEWVDVPPEWGVDVDTPDDLERLGSE